MVRAGMCVAAGVLAVAAWVGVVQFTSVEADAAQPPGPPPTAGAGGTKPVDLTALRDAVNTAAKKGENVDEISKALDALEKSAPKGGGRGVPPGQAQAGHHEDGQGAGPGAQACRGHELPPSVFGHGRPTPVNGPRASPRPRGRRRTPR